MTHEPSGQETTRASAFGAVTGRLSYKAVAFDAGLFRSTIGYLNRH